jgi:uncharacterized protein (TIGR03437 family)
MQRLAATERKLGVLAKHMRSIRTGLILLAAIWPATAQVWDNSGNNLLNGMYYFREVSITSNNAYALYGTINFTNGTYSINAMEVQFVEPDVVGSYTASGTYSISASGYGFIYNQLLASNLYGLVGANGVFVGSTTENAANDIFIAAPLTSQAVGTLSGSYSLAYMSDPVGTAAPFGALLQLTSDGAGKIGTVSLSAYSTNSTATQQSLPNVKYVASHGGFAVTFPASSTAMLQGPEYLYSTPDGSFVFGGSPSTFDMLVGVRTSTSGSSTSGSFGGLYYTAGFQADDSTFTGSGEVGLHTYYGSFSANNGVILGHQRIQDGTGAYSYTYSDSYPTTSGGSYNDAFLSTQFIAGDGGATEIGVGIGPLPGISVALQAPSLSGSGVYLNPTGVENSASYAPFTAGISRGEYITLTGTNLGPSTLQVASTVPFPTTLGNVQVYIDNRQAPIYYVSADQLAVIVPNETTSSVATIQVFNNGSASNLVTAFLQETTPGVFTEQQDGIGYGAVEHQDGSLVTPASPAQIGEIVSVYMAGLGDVSPGVPDGAAASSSSLSNTNNTITADIGGTAATVNFAGLAPGFVGLYQVNVVIPAGVTAGDNFIDIAGPDSLTSEALISVADPSSSAVPGAPLHLQSRPRAAMRRLP